jgi:REP element-mobilizing transposase RayT
MARPLRLEYPGALYHVISRGNERSTIFRDGRDHRTFLFTLGWVVEKVGWRVHSYCLLGNHYHLLVETPEANLSKGMHSLNGRYSQVFNRRHDRAGHVLEGRYKAIVVEKEAHLLELHRYIVLNPVRARLVTRPEDWSWSNYRATCGLRNRPSWLEVGWTLAQFGRDVRTAAASYVRFVMSGIAAADPPSAQAQIYLGGETFIAAVCGRLRCRAIDLEIPAIQQQPYRPTLDDVRAAVAEEWKLPEAALDRRRAGAPRIVAIYLATKACGLTARDVGAAFGIRRGRISNVVSEVERSRNPDLRMRIAAIARVLRFKGGLKDLTRFELEPKW